VFRTGIRPPAVVLGLAGAVLLTGCGGASGGQAQSPPALGTIPSITDPSQITLPTDPYLVTTAQIKQLSQASDAVAADCMRTFGFTSKGTLLANVDDEAASRLSRNYLYGVFNPGVVQTKGYDSQVQVNLPTGPGAAGQPQVSVEEQEAFTGLDNTGHPAGTVNGRKVPTGGCSQQGRDAIGGPLPSIADGDLPDGGPSVPPTDPRIADAYAKWSTCMKEKGYTYKDPTAAVGDPKWQPTGPGTGAVTPEQIATATADVQCKIANNTVGVIVAVETAYGKRYVDSHAQALTAYRQHLDETLAKAAKLVAQG
jgi:hypothetical protein